VGPPGTAAPAGVTVREVATVREAIAAALP
jgi:hypothetical protein